jgi:hypothetical protein
MRFTIQLVVEDQGCSKRIDEVIYLDKNIVDAGVVGITLLESKKITKLLHNKIILQQAKSHADSQRICLQCNKKRRLKCYQSVQFRTLFGIVNIPSPRLYYCLCENSAVKTFSPISQWLTDKNSPELQYIETKWASLISYQLTAKMLQDVLPVGETENASTVRNHLQKIAKRKEKELEGKPEYISGCPRDWGNLPKPDKPITVGIDGGYLTHWHKKNKNFEIIAGKSFSSTQSSKRFGFIQAIDNRPRRRLMDVLNSQGMQANQQITFLSDGADNVRDLQYRMYPESEHILDWFHLTMRLTVLNQFAKGLVRSDVPQGSEVTKDLESIKWYLWHGNTKEALEYIEDCYAICMDKDLKYKNKKKLLNHLNELDTYIENNCHLIPNYSERWRYGEAISTGFVESTINEVIAKRMVKKQQMQWTQEGAHCILQTRVAVLNDDLQEDFKRWYPTFRISVSNKNEVHKMKKIA